MKNDFLKRLTSLVLFLVCFAGVVSVGFTSVAITEAPAISDVIKEPEENKYAIVSPVPTGSSISSIKQSPRLDTLRGKTIALVGGSFSASVTHAVLRDMLKKEFGCKTYYMDEIGKGGTYNPANVSEQAKEFQKKLKEYGVDAVISGNCGCGICTVKETGNAIASEYIGIPAVVVGAETFIPQIESTAYNRGVPVIRTAAYPGAFASDTTEIQQQKAKEILYNQVVKGLTEEIKKEEADRIAGSIGSVKYDDVIFTGSYQRVQEFYEVNEMTDGLPVVPPTNEKIEYYLNYTPLNATDNVCEKNGKSLPVPPANRIITAYQVAANCIMAGCPPEYMPLCISITRCFANGYFYKPLQSTHAWTPYVLISGPVARQLGISCDNGMINKETNKLLGRFISLAMLNLAGYKIKENRMGTFGYMLPFAFSEDEKTCLEIGWNPYHVEKGFDLNDSVVTCGSTITWGNPISIGTAEADKAMSLIAWDITEKQQNALGNTNPRVPRMIMLTGDTARNLSKLYPSKTEFENALINTAKRPLWMRSYAHYWANTGSKIHKNISFDKHYDNIKKGASTENVEADITMSTKPPIWLSDVVPYPSLDTTQTMDKGHTGIVITGGNSGKSAQVMPGGDCCSYKIELPKNWDTLPKTISRSSIDKYNLSR